ncbi:MAG: hypothetical protein K9J81_06125 [Desulfohalobiaceae bacterium]|nr:hypothetical protein [Desulfohalobiaceae bacterium]
MPLFEVSASGPEGCLGSGLPPAKLSYNYKKKLQKQEYATTLMLDSFSAGLINEETLLIQKAVAFTRHCEASSPKQSLTRGSSERLLRLQ